MSEFVCASLAHHDHPALVGISISVTYDNLEREPVISVCIPSTAIYQVTIHTPCQRVLVDGDTTAREISYWVRKCKNKPSNILLTPIPANRRAVDQPGQGICTDPNPSEQPATLGALVRGHSRGFEFVIDKAPQTPTQPNSPVQDVNSFSKNSPNVCAGGIHKRKRPHSGKMDDDDNGEGGSVHGRVPPARRRSERLGGKLNA